MKKCVIFVHPTLSVEYLANVAHEHGYQVLSLITAFESTQINAGQLAEVSDFVIQGSANPEKDLPEIIEFIKANDLEVKAIINGIDPAIYYTDYLQNYILGYDIDLNASKARLNKFEVNAILQKNNIKIIPTIQICSKDELTVQRESINKLQWPIVAKPSEDTAAMSGFAILSNWQELEAYFDSYFGSKNKYYKDKTINKIILQEYIDINVYEEFVIDFISFEGKHYCKGILLYDKSIEGEGYKIYRYYRPYTFNEVPNIKPIIDYVSQCLTALKIQYGFTHNEVFWDHKNSYYLIESNNRMPGHGVTEAYYHVYHYTAFSEYLALLEAKSIEHVPQQRYNFSIVLDLYNTSRKSSKLNTDGISSFQKIVNFRNHEKLPEDFYKHYTRVEHVNASILLKNQSLDRLNADIDELLERERNGTLFIN